MLYGQGMFQSAVHYEFGKVAFILVCASILDVEISSYDEGNLPEFDEGPDLRQNFQIVQAEALSRDEVQGDKGDRDPFEPHYCRRPAGSLTMGAFGFVTVLPSEHVCLAMLPDEHHGTPTGPEFGPLCGSGWGESRHPADRTEPLLDEVEHVLWNVVFRYHDNLCCWRKGGGDGFVKKTFV